MTKIIPSLVALNRWCSQASDKMRVWMVLESIAGKAHLAVLSHKSSHDFSARWRPPVRVRPGTAACTPWRQSSQQSPFLSSTPPAPGQFYAPVVRRKTLVLSVAAIAIDFWRKRGDRKKLQKLKKKKSGATFDRRLLRKPGWNQHICGHLVTP